MFRFVLPLLLATACVAVTDDKADGEAETAAMQAVGKADGAGFVGIYGSNASTHRNGDIPNLELRAATYIRLRCYQASCAEQAAETDTYDLYTSSTGRTYVRFWSEQLTRDGQGTLQPSPVIADVYEIRATGTGIKLRKAYSSRWQVLDATSDDVLCSASGGTLAPTGCACPNSTYNDHGYEHYVAGAGGCIAVPGGGEAACDGSDGLYTDDDITAIGTFCVCGLGRHVVDAGSCAAL